MTLLEGTAPAAFAVVPVVAAVAVAVVAARFAVGQLQG